MTQHVADCSYSAELCRTGSALSGAAVVAPKHQRRTPGIRSRTRRRFSALPVAKLGERFRLEFLPEISECLRVLRFGVVCDIPRRPVRKLQQNLFCCFSRKLASLKTHLLPLCHLDLCGFGVVLAVTSERQLHSLPNYTTGEYARFDCGGIAMMAEFYRWLKDPDNRGILVLIGGALAGLGSVYVYFHPVRPSSEATKTAVVVPAAPELLRVCRSDGEGSCSAHDRFIGCTELDIWRKSACKTFYEFVTKDSDIGGGQCGHALYRIKCGP
jgi:hypothetical protein